MKQRIKLSSEQEQQQDALQQTRPQTIHEFASPEKLLQFDAAQTLVPRDIAQRLARSTSELPAAPRRPWWRNLLGQ